MKPQLQRYQSGFGNYGDCHRTCVAMILNMDRDDVPHFMEDLRPGLPATDPASIACEQREAEWLAERGLATTSIPFLPETTLDTILWQLRHTARGAVLLGCGTDAGDHSVVIYEGEIHNPHPNLPITGPMLDGHWWLTFYIVGPNFDPACWCKELRS